MPVYVGADKLAEAFGISERSVQRLVIYEGMPRGTRGQYDYFICLAWYIRYRHKKICGCAGPCDGFDAESRDVVNARAERKKALKEIPDIAPELVGLDADGIRQRLR